MKTVNILGTKYSFKYDDLNNPKLDVNDGVCELYEKEIIVRAPEYMCAYSEKARQYRTDHVIRHELIHAVAQECGVPHGNDEDLVDWIAHIIPIINKAFDELKKGD